MTEVISAVYEKGILRPLQSLNLRERQKVRIQVIAEDATEDEGADAIRILVAAGLMHPKPKGKLPPDPVPAEERQRLADLMGHAPGKPLSEIILEERGDL
jgi:predicted DNA-binding antitoxin AbrB/MazE fold protein